MFKLIVLNSEADWVEAKLLEFKRVFEKESDEYTTTFFNNKPSSMFSFSDKPNFDFVNVLFVKTYKNTPAYLLNDYHVRHWIFTSKGGYTSEIAGHDSSWKTQSERYAKIKLYQLANIPQQGWIL